MENLNSSSDADVKRIMKEKKMDWVEAWTYIRCLELQDGASICCSEEDEEHESSILELVVAADLGAEKRAARQSGRAAPVPQELESEEHEEGSEESDSENK
jgi:hypothetical protein